MFVVFPQSVLYDPSRLIVHYILVDYLPITLGDRRRFVSVQVSLACTRLVPDRVMRIE